MESFGIIFLYLFGILWEGGNIAMFVCGILGCCGVLNIVLGGAIAMIVLGALFGVLPCFRTFLPSQEEW